MPNDRPDPGEFLEMAQRMLQELFGGMRRDDEPWAEATRRARESATWERGRRTREPSPDEQRENLTFALATRAVEALEDLSLNVAAIRQRLERTGTQARGDGKGDGKGDGNDRAGAKAMSKGDDKAGVTSMAKDTGKANETVEDEDEGESADEVS